MAISMSVNELLKWATEETRVADALEDTLKSFGEAVGIDLEESVTRHRERSRWLDEQVAKILEERDDG